MNTDLKILISNDDGVYSEGINALYKEIKSKFQNVVVVAPDRNQSAASHSFTLANPLRIQQLHTSDFYSVHGTPSDSVYLAVNSLLDDKPDIVISGINEGPNLGDDVMYSGTVAAAVEGRHLKMPAIAVSLVGKEHYSTAVFFVMKILKQIEECPIPKDHILNINVPDLPLEQIKGIKVTILGKRESPTSVIKSKDPRGKEICWIGPQGVAIDTADDTDFWAVDNGYVSVTPIHIELTSFNVISDLNNWFMCNV